MVFLTHTETPDGNIVLLAINGILDGATSPRFDDYITQLIEKGKFRQDLYYRHGLSSTPPGSSMSVPPASA